MGEESIAKQFGLHLKSLRASKGVSQERLGLMAGLHPTYISLLERGINQPSLKSIIDIARCLDIGVDELLAPFIKK